MTTNAFISNELIEVNLNANGVSPLNYVTLPEGSEISGFGESTPLVDVTHYQSTSREYIGGLADGDEFSITSNRVHASPDYQNQMMVTLKGLTRGMRITETDTSVSPNTVRIYSFDVVILGWTQNAPVGDKVSITFNFKITGGITIS